MERTAEARAAVASARRRLVVVAVAAEAARGALLGALVGGAAWGVGRSFGADAGLFPLAAPLAGALAGAAFALRRGVRFDVAALTLDAAARTEEAFVSAVAATEAVPEFRALSAEYAVARCPPSAVGRFLPFRAPALAAAAAVATGLLAALVLVPRSSRAESEGPPVLGKDDLTPIVGASTGSRGLQTSPRDRVDRLRQDVEKGATPEPSAATAVRGDLAAVSDTELRELAKALDERMPSDATKRALAALGRGDRAAATAALLEALGGGTTVSSSDGTGSGTSAPSPGAPARSSAPWAAATWPLRYDRVVRRWLDETAAAEAPPK